MNGIGSTTSFIISCIYINSWFRCIGGKVDEWMGGMLDIGIGLNVSRGKKISTTLFCLKNLLHCEGL